MKVATIIKPGNGCSFYRCHLPIGYMPNNGDVYKLFYPEGTIPVEQTNDVIGLISQIDAFEPDIIFFNGIIVEKSVDWFKEQKKKGVKIVMDVDDYWELSSTHPVYNHWYGGGYNILMTELLQIADVVFAVNEQLRKYVLFYNKNCIVIPNAVPFGELHYTKQIVERPDKINFLYSGGSTHYKDILILKDKFERLGADKSVTDKAVFSLAGFNPLPDRHCEWDKMASIFKRTNSYRIQNTKPLQEHMSFYDEADVVLVPLIDSSFNRCKSFLKIIEASTRKLPCIVSNVLPYSELKDFPILWENWIQNIKYCINNRTFAQDMGEKLAEKMQEKYNLSVWSLTRYQIFSHLLNK